MRRRALLVAAASSTALVRAFAPPMPSPQPHTRCAASAPGEPEAEGERDEAEGAAEAEEELLPAARIQSSGLETIDDFRLTRSRLTFRRSQEVQRRRPRHLPYDEAAKWARAMNRWETAEEWREWLESGEKRNAYIPNDPPKYYGDDWRGWDHFLLGADDDPDGDAGPAS